MNAPERWAPIPGYEGTYEVSDHGRVQSLDRTLVDATGRRQVVTGRILKQTPNTFGYRCVGLWCGNQRVTRAVHTLVLLAFVGPRPEGLEGLHRNGDSTDNRLSNLHYGTSSENTLDTVRHGTHNHARRDRCIHGHEFAYVQRRKNGKTQRVCRVCNRIGVALRQWQANIHYQVVFKSRPGPDVKSERRRRARVGHVIGAAS